jgi:hypothetical protein
MDRVWIEYGRGTHTSHKNILNILRNIDISEKVDIFALWNI